MQQSVSRLFWPLVVTEVCRPGSAGLCLKKSDCRSRACTKPKCSHEGNKQGAKLREYRLLENEMRVILLFEMV